MPTVHYTVFVYVITGLGCTLILSACAMLVQVALWQTLQKASHLNSYTTSPFRRPFSSFSSMLILLGSILALMVLRFTLLHAAA